MVIKDGEIKTLVTMSFAIRSPDLPIRSLWLPAARNEEVSLGSLTRATRI